MTWLKNLARKLLLRLAGPEQECKEAVAPPVAPPPAPEEPTAGEFGEEDYSLYQPAERLIYSYYNGEKVVLADPMSLYRKLMDVSTDLSIDWKIAFSQSNAAGAAYDKMVGRIMKVFDLSPFDDGKGLTQPEMVALLSHFLAYVTAVKKNSSPFPTLPTETLATSPSSTGESPATESGSDSGSTASAPPTDAPTPSPSASA